MERRCKLREERIRIHIMENSKETKTYHDKRPQFRNKGPSKLRQQFGKGMTAFLVVAASIVFYFAFLRFNGISNIFEKIFQILKPIIYGLVIAYLLNPIVKLVERHLTPFLEKKLKKKETAHKIGRGTGIFTALIFSVFVIVALCNMLIPELYKSIRDLIVTLPEQMNNWAQDMNAFLISNSTLDTMLKNIITEGTDAMENWLKTDLLQQANTLMSNLTVGVINVVSEIMNVLIGFIVSVYVLFSKELFSGQCKKIVYALMKPDHANMALHITKKSNEIFGGFIIGKIIDSAIIGVLCFIALSIMNMPYTLIVSVIVGVTNVIPFFEPYIGAIPSTILIMIAEPIQGLYFAIFILILQQIDGNIIGPKILGDSTGLSAFWVVFSILLGGGLFGFVGMIMGVPTFAVLYYIAQMFINQKLERKKLPTSSERYGSESYVNDEGEFIECEEKGE